MAGLLGRPSVSFSRSMWGAVSGVASMRCLEEANKSTPWERSKKDCLFGLSFRLLGRSWLSGLRSRQPDFRQKKKKTVMRVRLSRGGPSLPSTVTRAAPQGHPKTRRLRRPPSSYLSFRPAGAEKCIQPLSRGAAAVDHFWGSSRWLNFLSGASGFAPVDSRPASLSMRSKSRAGASFFWPRHPTVL